MMMDLRLQASGLRKDFNRKGIFRDVTFTVGAGETLLITGSNGSGKSTLVKIISDVLSPTAGTLDLIVDRDTVTRRSRWCGLVSPYLQLYDEFSALENLELCLRIRGYQAASGPMMSALETVGLAKRGKDVVRTFSSGMKQRLKYAFALIHEPAVLILDEPTANLDAGGIGMVRKVMQDQRNKGILIVATNDLTDVEQYDCRIDLHGTR